MAAISVIIPVYKVEEYVARCLDSLIAQTFSDWEAICVDDGSPDGSPRILDRYAELDSRIKVFHRANGGAAVARNFGVEQASGSYCLMVDSDDFLHPQLMEITYSMAVRTDADIVAYTYHHPYHTFGEVRHFLGLGDARKVRYRNYSVDSIAYKVVDNIFDYTTEDPHPKGPERKWVVKHCQPWRCLYRMSVVKDLRFTPGIMYEDVAWWGAVLIGTRKACIINLPLYYYYPNKTGYIHSSRQQFRLDSLRKAIEESESIFAERATAEQREKWERNFLSNFRERLERKSRRLKSS